MATEEEFGAALRAVVAELTARHYGIPVPDAGEASPGWRIMSAITTGLIDGLPGEGGPNLLRFLGEMAARAGG